jgi:hypothetical protein
MTAKTSFVDWNFASEHVQLELQNGEYVSAESTLILAGPSRLKMIQDTSPDPLAAKSRLFPVGLLQTMQVAQNRQVARLFEIGSKRSYFVPGRLFANFQVNRILFYGPSLMRLLYAVAPRRGYGQPFNFAPDGTSPRQEDQLVTPPAYESLFPSSDKQFLLPPGHGGKSADDNRDFFINLASELFNIPFGLAPLMKDARQRPYGSFYMEDCMIEAHSIGFDSNNIVIAEGVNGQFDMLMPVQVYDRTAAAA